MELLILILLALYILPTVIAALRNVKAVAGIVVLNLLLGWTLIGWVGALVWAVSGPRHEEPSRS